MSLRYQDYPNLPDGHIIIEGRDYPYAIFRKLAALAPGKEVAIGFADNRATAREIDTSFVADLQVAVRNLRGQLGVAEAEIERLKAKALKQPGRNKMIGGAPIDK